MPKGEAGQLEIEIRARLKKFEKDLKEAERKAAKSGKKIEKSSRVTLGGIQGVAATATGAFGAIEAATKGAVAVSKLFKGDIVDAADALEQMPLGIGGAASGIKALLGEITGISAEIKEIEESTKKIESETERRVKSTLKLQAMEDRARKEREKLEFERRMKTLSPAEQEVARVKRAGEKRLAGLRERMGEATITGRGAKMDPVRMEAIEEIKKLQQAIVSGMASEVAGIRAGAQGQVAANLDRQIASKTSVLQQKKRRIGSSPISRELSEELRREQEVIDAMKEQRAAYNV